MLISPQQVDWDNLDFDFDKNRKRINIITKYQLKQEELVYIWASLSDCLKDMVIRNQNAIDIEFLRDHWPSGRDSITAICEKKNLPLDLLNKIWLDWSRDNLVTNTILEHQPLQIEFIKAIFPTLLQHAMYTLILNKKLNKQTLSDIWELIPQTDFDLRTTLLKRKIKNDWTFIRNNLYSLSVEELSYLEREHPSFIESLPIEYLPKLLTSSSSRIRNVGISSASNIIFLEVSE